MWTCYYTLLPILLLSLGAVHALFGDDNSETRFRCYDGSLSNFYEYNFDNPTPMLSSPCFNPSRVSLFFTYGLDGNNTGPFVLAFVEAQLKANYNVILVVWEKYTSIDIIGDAAYPVIAINALKYGAECGKALVSLFRAGLRLFSVRLVGFSLGAHFMGQAAKTCKTAGYTIQLLIGLDPAGPLFTGVLSIGGISRTDAVTVLVIHTNPGRLGTSESKGTVDLWINCGNPIQPGCATGGGGTSIISLPDSCSHNRAWMFYIEAGQNPGAFIGIIALNCNGFRNGNVGSRTFTLGYNIETGLQGNFYLTTNSAPPYGRGVAGTRP